MKALRLFLLAALSCGFLQGEDAVFVYLTGLTSDSARIAWGRTKGDGNIIGRNARPLGRVEVSIADRTLVEEKRAWVEVDGLEPDHSYDYQVRLGRRLLGQGTLRTFPRQSPKMAFLLIGDYGKGNKTQRSIGQAMWKTLLSQREKGNPVRFVLTTGDNIYGSFLYRFKTGKRDRHWHKRFFDPFRQLLPHVPFYPSLGNHDGDETESEDDFPVYADNFFLPPMGSLEGSTARYYGVSFAGLALFLILDSTEHPRPDGGRIYEQGGAQHVWLRQALASSNVPWKIAVFHNPSYNAGPRYGESEPRLDYLEELFVESGVDVVFNGHEHNFQSSDPPRTGGILHIISGGGAETRNKNIVDDLEEHSMALWSPQPHYLLVEIEEGRMHITALGTDAAPVTARTPDNVATPARITVSQRP
ncbi:MAG TPA: metallophosphoesterase [Acidobacteriota bacterium]|nr:metallophosphoesterase [Acidobacteriota bacterium]